MSSSNLLLATAITHGFLALSHTAQGLTMLKHASLSALPTTLLGALTAGWFEGSAFLSMTAVLNLKWARRGAIADPLDRVVAGMIIALCWGAAAQYARVGLRRPAVVLAAVGVLQGLGLRV